MKDDIIKRHLEAVTPEAILRFRVNYFAVFASATSGMGLVEIGVRDGNLIEVRVAGVCEITTTSPIMAIEEYALRLRR